MMSVLYWVGVVLKRIGEVPLALVELPLVGWVVLGWLELIGASLLLHLGIKGGEELMDMTASVMSIIFK